jgi:hypothetical protein
MNERVRAISSIGALEAFAGIPLGPTNLRRIFLLLTQLHYSDSKNYGPMEEQLKDFVWHKDKPGEAKSKLFVGLDYVFDPTKTDQFPGIFVGIGDIQYKRVVINNLDSYTNDRAGSKNILQGGTTVILRHTSLTPDEALAMAELSFQFYTGVREMLMKRMNLVAFDVSQISTPRFFDLDGKELADKRYSADLILGIAFDASWITLTESHRLKKITLGQLLCEME